MTDKTQKNFDLKNCFINALMVAPTLAVVILSAAFYVIFTSMGQSEDSMLLVILSVSSLLSLTASTVLSFLFKKPFVTALLSVIFSLCFICYLVFTVSGTTDVFSDSLFEKIMLAFSFPISSYFSFAVRFFGSLANTAALVITGIVAAVNIVSTTITVKKADAAGVKKIG